MAGFTALALLGGGLLGGQAIGRLTAPRPQQAASATGNGRRQLTPEGAQRPAAPIAPTPPPVDRGGAEVAARQAAVRQRRRAASGASPSRPQPTGSILAPQLQPRTLVGY
jgi:hypothetical protein